jgi:excisionase family DNA binding protein
MNTKTVEALLDPQRIAYSVYEAARLMGVSKSTLYSRVRAGELKTYKWHGRTLIRREDLISVIEQSGGQG